MNQLNQIIIEGNLVRDAESKVVSSGRKLCTFTIAHNRSYKKADGAIEENVSYFDCEAWEKLAETSAKKALKGSRVRIVGRLAQSRWSDAEGKSHSQTRIVCEHAEYLVNHQAQGDVAASNPNSENGQNGTAGAETQEGNFDIPF